MDVADYAEQREQHARDAAINAVTQKKPEPQLVIEGQIVCADCLDPINPRCLQKLPTASRCVQCQTEHEQ